MNNQIHKNKLISPSSVILIVDRVGVFGERLAEQYSNDFFVILITNRKSGIDNTRITKLRFGGNSPKVPQNNYSKILVVDDGDRSSDYIESFIKEGRKLNSEFYYLASLRNPNLKKISPTIKNYENGKVLIFGDVFDNEIYFEKEAEITRYIFGSRSNGKIIVSNDGLGESFPIALEDTVRLIIKATHIKVPQKNILLFYTTPTTDLTLAHMFQKIDPNIDVDFKRKDKVVSFYFPKESTFAIRKYNIQKEISKIDLSRKKRLPTVYKENKNKDLFFAKYFFVFILLVIFMIILPFLTTKVYTYLGYHQITSSHEKAKNGDYETALGKSNNAVSLFEFAEKGNEIFESQLGIFGKQYLNDGLEEQIVNGYVVANVSTDFYKSLIFFENIYNRESLDAKVEFEEGLRFLQSAYSSYIKNDLYNKKLNISEKRINDALPSIEKIVAVSEVLPSILGFDEEKEYLILFTNNTSLRPNGGIVEAVGVLSIKDFQISNFEIFNASDIDEEKIINIESPFSTRRFLGEKTYSFENGGMNLDFVTNSIKASSAYGLVKNKEVDGVIGIDLFYIKNLLEQTGEIEVDDVGLISANNIIRTFEGSREPSDLYVSILNSLFEKVEQENLGVYYLFLNPFGSMTSEGHLLFAFKDRDVQNVFTANDLSGSVSESVKEQPDLLNDYLGIFDTNFGNNNISHLVSKSVLKENLILPNGDFETVLSISYKNGSEKESANYINYLQIILPLGTRINEISVGGIKADLISAISDPNIFEQESFVNPEGLELKQGVEMGKSVYGFLVEIPADSVSTVKIKYTLPFKAPLSSKAIPYSLTLYKQPGTYSYPFNMMFDSTKFNILPDKVYKTELKTNKLLRFVLTEN